MQIRFLGTIASLLLLCGASDALADGGPLALPASLEGRAEVLDPNDPDFGRAGVGSAVQPEGKGGVSEALVIRLSAELPVYRMWSGPEKVDANGNTNRLGGWWSYDAPSGPVQGYRVAYEICEQWNDLTWVATCTLQPGAVVAIGPGQSVSAQTCDNPSREESYPANPEDWQLYVAKSWTRLGEGKELVCPDASADYEADPADISRPIAPAVTESPEASPAVEPERRGLFRRLRDCLRR